MYCVLWTYTVPSSLSGEAIRRQCAVVAESQDGHVVGLGLTSSTAAPPAR